MPKMAALQEEDRGFTSWLRSVRDQFANDTKNAISPPLTKGMVARANLTDSIAAENPKWSKNKVIKAADAEVNKRYKELTEGLAERLYAAPADADDLHAQSSNQLFAPDPNPIAKTQSES